VDIRSDIYSLGATLYHMVTGQPPYPGTKVDEVLKAHLEQELTPPDHLNTQLSAGLGEVVEFMLAKDRRQRYATPDELILDLECLQSGEPPKLARQRIEAATLRKLAEGEAEEEDDAIRATFARSRQNLLVWIGVPC
jgi:serine/threonine-protein kinase